MANPSKSEASGFSSPVQPQEAKVKDEDEDDLKQNPQEKSKDVKKSRRQLYKEAKAAKAVDKSNVDAAQKDQQGSVLKNFFVSLQLEVEFRANVTQRILSYGDKWAKVCLTLCVITAIGSGVAMPLMFLVFGQLVGNFAGYFTPGSTVTEAQFLHQVRKNTLYMVAIGASRFVLSYTALFTVRISGLRTSARLRLIYLTALFKQPVSVIDQTSPGKISQRLTTNANTIQMGISQQLSQMIQSIALTIGLYVVSFIRGPLLTLVASATIPVTLIIYSLIVPIVFKNQRRAEQYKEQASALSFEIFESIRIVAAFGAESKLEAKHTDFIERARRLERSNGPWMGMLMAPMFWSVFSTFALTFWFGIKEVTHGHLDGIGSITVVLFSVNFAATGLGRLVAPIMGMIRAANAAQELFVTIDAPAPDMTGLKDPDVTADSDIEFRDVYFTYPTRSDAQILNKLNVVFQKGKVNAIVGPSGSGKSTIVGLIQRWYQPTPPITKTENENHKLEDVGSIQSSEKEKTDNDIITSSQPLTIDEKSNAGAVYIGGVNLETIDAKWWRLQVGLVQQEPFLFNDTIYNNVANGLTGTKWENLPKEEKFAMVKHACTESFADDFISKLPDVSYSTSELELC
jgi:ATP-binding cassette, subfamily B (MDR/TAP), member 1